MPGGEPEADVGFDGQVREQAALLRDVADPAPFRPGVDARAIDQDVADLDRAGVGAVEAGHQPQQGRLAATGGTENRRQGSGWHLQVHAGQNRVGSEGLMQAGNRHLPHTLILALEPGD
jgi:hypothetical protein